MKLQQSGTTLALDMGVPVLEDVGIDRSPHQTSLRSAQDHVGAVPRRILAASLGTKLPARWAQGRSSSTTPFRGADFAAQPTLSQLSFQRSITAMGGLEIDENYAVLGSDSEAIGGLNAAGEVAGGVHGNYRSGGNSLLDCRVFGRVTGVACARSVLGDRAQTCRI